LTPAVAAAFIDAATAFDSIKKTSTHICAPASINHSLALFDLMLTDRSVNDNVLDKGIVNIIPETAFLFNSHPSSKVVESKGLAKNRGSHVAKPLNPRRPIILTAVFIYQVWVRNARSSRFPEGSDKTMRVTNARRIRDSVQESINRTPRALFSSSVTFF